MDEDTHLTAKWAKLHDVTFRSENGEDDFTEIIEDGETVERPAAPSRNGYIFAGWYTEDGEAYDFANPVEDDMILTACWAPITTSGTTSGTANPASSGSANTGNSGETITDIPDGDVPLTDIPDGDIPLTDIPEGDVPLSDVPQTGDDSQLWEFLAIVSGAGLALPVLKNKKREDIAE